MFVWRIQFLECSYDYFDFVFMVILFYLIFLFCGRNDLDNLIYVLIPHIILLRLYTLSRFFRFKYWLHSWQDQLLCDPNYSTSPHLVGYMYLRWYFLFFVRTLHRFCLAIWRPGLVHFVLCIDLTCVMYRQYVFLHNLGICTYFLYLLVFVLW